MMGGQGFAHRALQLGLIFVLLTPCVSAQAAPSVVIDVASGSILHQDDATRSWFPASLTKLMTAYVALKAVKDGRMTLNTPLVVSAKATRMAPSKMGFKPGTEVTLDNALKMLMVKSANDIAVTIAEGVSGSVEAFAVEMNQAAARIGMRESRFVNPNGLPDERQVTSARDMALLGRALQLEFPEQDELFGIGALKLGPRILPTHNGLLGRYPGADGMKTGFTCAAGFNVVASATRGGRRLITVVMGSPTAVERTIKAGALFDKGFAGASSQGSIGALPSYGVAAAPNMRDEICRRRGKGAAPIDSEDASVTLSQDYTQSFHDESGRAMFVSPQAAPGAAPGRRMSLGPRPQFDPVPIFVGRAPGYNGVVASARPAGAPLSAAAYAPEKKKVLDGSASVLEADANALPLRLSGAATKPKGKKPVVQAKAVDEDDDDTPVKAKKPAAKKVVAKVTAKKPETKTAVKKPQAKTVSQKPTPITDDKDDE